jgi:hypothetical protein
MNPPALPETPTAIRKHSTRSSGSQVLSLILFLIGLACLLIIWPLGLLIIIIALLLDGRRIKITTCGACGNEVAPTSTLCPTCHIQLTAPPLRPQIIKWCIILLILMAAALIITNH